MEQLIIDLVLQHPGLMSVFIVIGVLRAIFKPLQLVAKAYVDATPDAKDNEALDKILSSKPYLAVAWALDYTASIKVPVKK